MASDTPCKDRVPSWFDATCTNVVLAPLYRRMEESNEERKDHSSTYSAAPSTLVHVRFPNGPEESAGGADVRDGSNFANFDGTIQLVPA